MISTAIGAVLRAGRPRDFARFGAWSALQALPALASGWVLAEAGGMFLTGRTVAGIGWLGLLFLAAAVGAVGTRQSFLSLGAIVEPMRDELVSDVVRGALPRSAATPDPAAGGAAGTAAVARLTHQAEIVRDAYAGLLTVVGTFVFTSLSTIAGLATLVPAVLVYVVPPLAVSVVILRLMLRPFAVRQRRLVLGEEAVARSSAAAVSGLRDVTACGAESAVLAGVDTEVQRQARAARSVAWLGAARLLFLAVGGWLPLLLVLIAAPHLLRSGVAPARLIGVLGYLGGSMRAALYTLSQGLGAGLVRLSVTLERLREASASSFITPGQDTCSPGPGDLVLRHLWFAYGGDPVIRDLSLDIPPGSHLAIVGPSGIGKSSLAALMAGMLTPVEGSVLIDGTPADECPTSARVLIPQEAYVFDGTLAENLCYLRDDPVPAAELDAAIDALGLGPLAGRLGGPRAAVHPARLSAGERQLVALARAYLSTAPVAILDEATCHLDPAAEARAETAFAARPGTLIVVAHRISSAMRARRVLVLDGTAAQAGTHRELLVSSPLYRDLVGYWTGAGSGPRYTRQNAV